MQNNIFLNIHTVVFYKTLFLFFNKILANLFLLTSENSNFINQNIKAILKDYPITQKFVKYIISLGIILENFFNK